MFAFIHDCVSTRSRCSTLRRPGSPGHVFVRNGATALHVAAEEDHVEIVQLLLEHGAVVDERKEYDFAAQIQARGVLTVLCQ